MGIVTARLAVGWIQGRNFLVGITSSGPGSSGDGPSTVPTERKEVGRGKARPVASLFSASFFCGVVCFLFCCVFSFSPNGLFSLWIKH